MRFNDYTHDFFRVRILLFLVRIDSAKKRRFLLRYNNMQKTGYNNSTTLDICRGYMIAVGKTSNLFGRSESESLRQRWMESRDIIVLIAMSFLKHCKAIYIEWKWHVWCRQKGHLKFMLREERRYEFRNDKLPSLADPTLLIAAFLISDIFCVFFLGSCKHGTRYLL